MHELVSNRNWILFFIFVGHVTAQLHIVSEQLYCVALVNNGEYQVIPPYHIRPGGCLKIMTCQTCAYAQLYWIHSQKSTRLFKIILFSSNTLPITNLWLFCISYRYRSEDLRNKVFFLEIWKYFWVLISIWLFSFSLFPSDTFSIPITNNSNLLNIWIKKVILETMNHVW